MDGQFLQGIGSVLGGTAAILALVLTAATGPSIGAWFKARSIIINERDSAQLRANSARSEAASWHSAHQGLIERLNVLEKTSALQGQRLSALTKFTREMLSYTEGLEELATTAGLTISHLTRPIIPDILVDSLEGGS
jgi:hypothetical protein